MKEKEKEQPKSKMQEQKKKQHEHATEHESNIEQIVNTIREGFTEFNEILANTKKKTNQPQQISINQVKSTPSNQIQRLGVQIQDTPQNQTQQPGTQVQRTQRVGTRGCV